MGSRAHLVEAVGALIDFGIVAVTKIGAEFNSVLATVRGDRDESGAEEDYENADLFQHAAIEYRPAPPSLPDESDAMEVAMLRQGDEIVVIASKDRRWQVSLAEGEVRVRAFGDNAASVLLKPDGTAVVNSSALFIGGDGASQAMVLGNALNTWLSQHTHNTGTGPSGPPNVVPGVPITNHLSTKHKVDA